MTHCGLGSKTSKLLYCELIEEFSMPIFITLQKNITNMMKIVELYNICQSMLSSI